MEAPSIQSDTNARIERSAKERGLDVAGLLENIYPKIPDYIACRSVESNIVLTLAGQKGQTEFYLPVSSREETKRILDDIGQLNKIFESCAPHIFLATSGQIFSPAFPPEDAMNKKALCVSIYNAEALKNIAAKTKIPGIKNFNKPADTQMPEYLMRWRADCFSGLERAQKTEEIPQDYELVHLYHGLIKGYPDIAIMDMLDAISKKKDISETMVISKIPFSATYHEAEPNYVFYPEHAEDESIKNNIKESGEILKAFYESGWHQKISSDPEFLEARRADQNKTFS